MTTITLQYSHVLLKRKVKLHLQLPWGAGPPFVLSKGQVVDKKRQSFRSTQIIFFYHLLTKKAELQLDKFYFSIIFFSELQKEEVQVRKPSFWYFLYQHHHFVLRHTLHNSLWGIVLFPDGNVHHLCFTVICAQSWDEYLIFS